MVRVLYLNAEGKLLTDLQPIDTAFAVHDDKGFLWIDLDREDGDVTQSMLIKRFNFHPLAVDDALQESHYPKLDDWGSYLYIVLHAVSLEVDDPERVDTQELDIFLGRNYMVTSHEETIVGLEKVWAGAQRDLRHMQGGVDHLLYQLVDELVASFMPVVESFDEQIDAIEAEIFRKPRPSTLEQIFTIKRSILYLRRIIAPQREVLNKLAREEYQVIDERDRVYFRDVYDHLVRMYDITDGVRDLVTSTLETYLSLTGNRMNDVMKTLTIITTIFMPISFLAGFFGMNFFQPSYAFDAWTGLLAFVITLLIMTMLPLSMILWMRRRGWLAL